MPRDERFRSLVKAKPGHVILSLDFSAIELRIAAALAMRAAKQVSRLIEGNFKDGEEARLDWLLPALRSSELPPPCLSFPVEPSQASMAQRGAWIQDSLRLATHRVRTNKEAILSGVFQNGLDPHLVTGLDLARRAGKISFPGSALEWLVSQGPQEQAALRKAFQYERQAAKACNFGLLYGMTAEGLYKRGLADHGLSWTVEEASQARMVWFDLYPDVRLWQLWTYHLRKIKKPIGGYLVWDNKAKDLVAPAHGGAGVYSVSTLTNRKFAILNDRRAASSYQNQGTGADILARSIALLTPEVAAMLILSVHDELVFEVPREDIQTVEGLVKDSMMRASDEVLRGRAPMQIEASASSSWS